MKKFKKALSLVLALAVILTMATATMSASAAYTPKFNLGQGSQKSSFIQDMINSLFPKKDPPADNTGSTTEKKPLIEWSVDYEVIRKFHLDGHIGRYETTTTTTTAPETTTTAPVVVPEEEAPKANLPQTTALQVVVPENK
ncbi:MAG: hypothetical protein RSD42_01250, partial [Oscillospiraceae bacterium]